MKLVIYARFSCHNQTEQSIEGQLKVCNVYHYYICKNSRKKLCDKKIIKKSYIENKVIEACLDELTESRINYIAQKVSEACKKDLNNVAVKRIKSAINEIDTAIENLWLGIEKGQAVEMLTERLNKRQEEKNELLAQLAIEENKCFTVNETDVCSSLTSSVPPPSDRRKATCFI